MGAMQPTTVLRWNEDVRTHQARVEQLWVDMAYPPGATFNIREPTSKKEWRPLELVKIGWKNGEFDKPLPYIGQ